MTINRDFLIKLRESTEFREVMLEAAKSRPIIPQWRALAGNEGEKLVEEIKYQSGKRDGFDALYALLTGRSLEP